MNFTQDWQAIRDFYSDITPLILAQEKNEWAVDAYAWAHGNMIFQTPIEEWLWRDIRACNAVLYPQYPVMGFFVDYANPKAKVAIECDGAAFHQDREKDAARDLKLTDAGWSVYRISGRDCRTDWNPETDEPSIAHRFIQDICTVHGISRSTHKAAGWQSIDAISTRVLAELIAKQRNGPTGTVKLSFLKHLTRFESMAQSYSEPHYPSRPVRPHYTDDR